MTTTLQRLRAMIETATDSDRPIWVQSAGIVQSIGNKPFAPVPVSSIDDIIAPDTQMSITELLNLLQGNDRAYLGFTLESVELDVINEGTALGGISVTYARYASYGFITCRDVVSYVVTIEPIAANDPACVELMKHLQSLGCELRLECCHS